MIAFLREVSPQLYRCPTRLAGRRLPKVERAIKQHAAYRKVLEGVGLETEMLPAFPDTPESAFLDDATLLLPEVAIISRPANLVRRADTESIADALSAYRPVQHIAEPGTLSGSDVLRIGRTLYASRSPRTNAEGVAGLREIAGPLGYEVKLVEVLGEASLREACSFIPPHFLLVNSTWIEPAAFGNLVVVHVAESEPFGANTLTLEGTTLVSASFPETEKRLQAAGITTRSVDISELEKVGGNLTRLCLVKEPRATAKASPMNHGLKTVAIPQVPSAFGHASQAIVHGGLVYVSAQLPFDPGAAKPLSLSPEEQTEQVLHNVSAVLSSAGSTLADVLQATVYLSDPRHLDRIESTYARMFAAHRPTRSVVSNRALPAGVLIEIAVVAAVSKGPNS